MKVEDHHQEASDLDLNILEHRHHRALEDLPWDMDSSLCRRLDLVDVSGFLPSHMVPF
jgi:hypothetical protein